jgi:type I restriction-modification system DNA methylase subunit
VPTPAELRKQFIKAFDRLAHHRERHDVLTDFLEMAVCAIRKKTLPPGPAADAMEDQYMAVVKRNTPEDVRAMPELLGIATLAVQEGGCDFLGQVVVELELSNEHMGQFFTPYDVSRMMAEMILTDTGEVMKERGFITLMEPASGAGGMIIAAADVIEKQGFNVGRQLYVDATDISPMCFKMTYLQASLRGIPATIRRGNSLSLEMFDQAVTPAFLPFYLTHRAAFDAWRNEAPAAPVQPVIVPQAKPSRTAGKPGTVPAQLNLFDPG